MKILAELNDENVLGLSGMSNAKPRVTARAILKRKDGLYAVMFAAKFSLYSLPGGGVDEGESIDEALRREVAEETGCRCEEIEPLGIISENRAHADFTQMSYYYMVKTSGVQEQNHLTPDEKQNATALQWHTLPEVMKLIGEPIHETNQRKFLQARDMAALNEYIKNDGAH